MRYFSYRNKLRLRSLLITVLIVLAVLIAIAIGIFIYLQRYIVYTPDGAHLDFSSRPGSTAETDSPTNPNFDVESSQPLPDLEIISGGATDETGTVGTNLVRLTGFYVTASMLSNPQAVLDVLESLTEPTAVLIDVKSIYGNYYYNSSISGAEYSSLLDIAAMDQLIETLAAKKEIYLIARLPAFRDSSYALANQDCGLPLSSGALWLDSDSCYWLDPENSKVISHLEGLVLELQSLGFDEVALDDFYFPDSSNIVYDGDRNASVVAAAQRLSANLTGEQIALSFYTADAALAPYATRIYLAENDGTQVQSIAQTFEGAYETLANHLVFVTDSRDTRFSTYSVLQPAIEDDTE